LTMLFWFGGFVALAVFLSGRICFGTVSFTVAKGVWCYKLTCMTDRSAMLRVRALPSAPSHGFFGPLHLFSVLSVSLRVVAWALGRRCLRPKRWICIRVCKMCG
jgi:hypothetical protein